MLTIVFMATILTQEQLEKRKAGVYLVNLETEEKKRIREEIFSKNKCVKNYCVGG